jgi:hypothetical protein
MPNSLIYYGPNINLYPYDDKSLWPWTLDTSPQFPVDVWACICKYLPAIDILRLGMVNKYLNNIVKNNEKVWVHFRRRLERIKESNLEKKSTWKYIMSLKWNTSNEFKLNCVTYKYYGTKVTDINRHDIEYYIVRVGGKQKWLNDYDISDIISIIVKKFDFIDVLEKDSIKRFN